MTAPAALPQHVIALQRANHTRHGRAELRTYIAAGDVDGTDELRSTVSRGRLADVLDDPPRCVSSAIVEHALQWIHRTGPQLARRHADAALEQLYPNAERIDSGWLTTQLLTKRVGRLTARERLALSIVLRRP